MIAFLGHLVLVFALVAAVLGAIGSFLGGRVPEGPLWGRRAAILVAVLVAAAVVLMEIALISHDFSVKYVADVGSRETPLYYTIISLWGALEGSILFWAFLLSLYTVVFLALYGRRARSGAQRELRTAATAGDEPLRGGADLYVNEHSRQESVLTWRDGSPSTQATFLPAVTGVLLTISAFFLIVMVGPGNPFVPLHPAPADGAGPNPLLQNHWMMGVHPQLLYLGYVGLSVPYAIAMASLLRGAPDATLLRLIRRWALIPWIFLSLGIVGGMWWSYAVLGWGGYWSWDPVENASIMPWLITTAFLHSLQVQERRGMLKAWTLSLIIAAFLFSILGTFLTRSGVLASVHSFTQTAIGPLFLGFFALVLVLSLGLLFARSRALASPGALESAVCRETAFLFNNLLLVAITFTILLGTIFPLLAEALGGSQLSVGAPYFNHVAVPIGFALLFLMGVGPALPWGATRGADLQYRLLGPVGMGVAVILLLLALGVRGIGSLVTFGATAFVFAVTWGRIRHDIRARRGNTGESTLRSAGRVAAMNPRRYGGYLAHIGVLLLVVGIAASQTYGMRSVVTLRPGQRATLGPYTVVYRGWQPHPESNRMVIAGTVDVYRGRSEGIGTLHPSQNMYLGLSTPVVTPAIREEPWDMIGGLAAGRSPLPDLAALLHGSNPFEDLYIVLEGVSSRRDGPATLQILINPMVGFIWLGGIILGLGGILALVPARRRRKVPVSMPERPALQPEEAVV